MAQSKAKATAVHKPYWILLQANLLGGVINYHVGDRLHYLGKALGESDEIKVTKVFLTYIEQTVIFHRVKHHAPGDSVIQMIGDGPGQTPVEFLAYWLEVGN